MSKYDLMLSDYSPHLDEEKQALMTQNKRIYLPLILTSLILIALTSSSIALFVSYSHRVHQLSTLQNDIQTLKSVIHYNSYNKTMSLNDTPIEEFVMRVSHKSSKRVESINLTNHSLYFLKDVSLPGLERLYVDADRWDQNGNKFLFRIVDCEFPDLEVLEMNDYYSLNGNYMGIKEFPRVSVAPELGSNYLPNIKNITLKNVLINNFFSNDLPTVEEMRFHNTSCFEIHNSLAPNLRILSINDSTNSLQSVRIANSSKLEKLEIISHNYFEIKFEGIPNLSEEHLRIPRVKRLDFTLSSMKNFKNSYKELVILTIQGDYGIETLDLSRFPKLAILQIIDSSLKFVKKSTTFFDTLSTIAIRNSSIERFSNLSLATRSLALVSNDFLVEFNGISASALLNLELPQSIARVFDNNIPSVFRLETSELSQHFINLQQFDGNTILNIQNLSLPYSKLSKISYNRFGHLQHLNLSHCHFNDTSVFTITTDNKYTQPHSLLSLDLSSNPITQKQSIRSMLQLFFINANIIL